MSLGRQCPRVIELGSLYPSLGLKRALCDYYASILRLCIHITTSLRGPSTYAPNEFSPLAIVEQGVC